VKAMNIKSLFKGEVPAVTFVVSLILTSVATGFVTYFTTTKVEHSKAVDAVRISDVSEFLKTSHEFEELTRVFMEKVVEKNAADPAAREALLNNIQKQHSMLQDAENYLNADQRVVTKRYRQDLTQLSTTLQLAEDVPTTAPVWRQMNTTLKDRRLVVAALRSAAQLPSTESTEPAKG
jgi:hypothetical protein